MRETNVHASIRLGFIKLADQFVSAVTSHLASLDFAS